MAAAAPANRGQHLSPRNHQDEVQYETIALSRGFLGRAGKMAAP
jgi:hypothetical protein